MKNALGKDEDLILYNKKGVMVYECYKVSDNYSRKITYDENGNELTFEDSDNYSRKKTFDKNSNELTFENSYGYSRKRTYDKNNKELTFEDSDGFRRGFEIPELNIEQLTERLGYNFKLIK
jgi:hypothetical protein